MNTRSIINKYLVYKDQNVSNDHNYLKQQKQDNCNPIQHLF